MDKAIVEEALIECGLHDFFKIKPIRLVTDSRYSPRRGYIELGKSTEEEIELEIVFDVIDRSSYWELGIKYTVADDGIDSAKFRIVEPTLKEVLISGFKAVMHHFDYEIEMLSNITAGENTHFGMMRHDQLRKMWKMKLGF